MNSYNNINKLKKLFSDETEGKLNFSNVDHAQHFMDIHGGEELLKTKYKAVYAAILKTIEKHKNSSCDPDLVMLHAEAPVEQKNSTFEPMQNGNKTINITSKAWITPHSKYPLVRLTANLINCDSEGLAYDSTSQEFTYSEDVDIFEVHMSASDAEITTDKKEGVFTSLNVCSVSRDCTIGMEYVNSPITYVNGYYDFVDSFNISHPRSYKTLSHDPIRVMYGKRSTNNADYPYDKITEEDGKVKTCLPMSGNIILKKGYTPKVECQVKSKAPKLSLEGRKVATYSNSSIVFEIDKNNKQQLNFKFDEDWKYKFDSTEFSSQNKAFLQCPFYCTVEHNGKETAYAFIINSTKKDRTKPYYSVKENSKVYVPYIYYEWGCFGKDTTVQMGDGSSKNIANICPGDKIATYNGEVVTVQELMTGKEKYMVHIETENNNIILLTGNHPILTRRGLVAASKVNAADYLIMGDGTHSHVRFIYIEEYNDMVYNLNTGEKPQCIITNGFVAGDAKQQNTPLKDTVKSEPISPELQELITEMNMLGKELCMDQPKLKDIVIIDGVPLVITKGDLAKYNKVTLLEGGCIEIRCNNVELSINRLKKNKENSKSANLDLDHSKEQQGQSDSLPKEDDKYDIVIIGETEEKPAESGTNGKSGGSGGSGLNGGYGAQGGDGFHGKNGANGTSLSNVKITIANLMSNLTIINVGGDGQNGGHGGHGGDGGDGGDGCVGGDGGDGGNGGSCGAGGNGGAGCMVNVSYGSKNDSVINAYDSMSNGGKSGKAGIGGTGGTGGNAVCDAERNGLGGRKGRNGLKAKDGKDGIKGITEINIIT